MKLRKKAQNVLIGVVLILGSLACMIDDFDMSVLPFMILLIVIIGGSTYALIRWGDL